MGEGIEILNLRRVRVVHDRPVLEVRDTQNFFEGLAIGKVNDGVIKFFAADKING
jgi:hypothetical protein